jgi:hypothetical protein
MTNLERYGIPQPDPSERQPSPEDVKLANGDPLYYLFLEDAGGAGVIRPEDSQQAHEQLRTIFAANPDAVLACDGKSPDEARKILSEIGMKEAA